MSDLLIIITLAVIGFSAFALYKAYKNNEFRYLQSLIKGKSEDKKRHEQ